MAAHTFRCTAGATGYDVLVGPGMLDVLVQDLTIGGKLGVSAAASLVVITDRNAWHYHGARFVHALRQAGRTPLVKILPPGESSKTRKTKEEVEDWMLENRCLRDTIVIAVGGGVVGDLSGFIASTYMRGVPFVQVPTTLLAQVDSSIGGKTGLDTPAGKNLIGAFHQPRAVYADTSVLSTLPVREVSNGLAEAAKTGAIADAGLWELMEQHGEGLLGVQAAGAYGVLYEGEGGAIAEVVLEPSSRPLSSLPPSATTTPLPHARALPLGPLTDVIARTVAVKVRVVNGDEREGGERAILNFGHTVGHGVEAVLQPSWLHGECVAVGMLKEVETARALAIAQGRAGGADSALVARVKRVLKSLGLPVTLPPSLQAGPGLSSALAYMGVDKKNSGGGEAGVKVVLLAGIGSVVAPPYAHSVPLSLVRRVMSAAVTVHPLHTLHTHPRPAGPPPCYTEDSPLRVRVPGSKSISNRALLLAGLARGTTVIRGLLASDDTQVMLSCLAAMGAAWRMVPDPGRQGAPPCVEVRGTGGAFTLPPVDPAAPGGRVTLYVQNAGTASRFLASTLALLPYHALPQGQAVVLAGNARMAVRPIGPLVDALRAQGALISYSGKEGCPPLSCTRGVCAWADSVTAGETTARAQEESYRPGCAYRRRVVHLQAKLSSQYVSSVLFSAPYFPPVLLDSSQGGQQHGQGALPPYPTWETDGPSNPACWTEVVLAEEHPTSLPYITMTCSTMADFGVSVVKLADNRYLVPRCAYVSPAGSPHGLYEVEPDASSASYPAAWAVLTRTPLLLEGIGSRSTQGDAALPLLLARMGAHVRQGEQDTLILPPQPLSTQHGTTPPAGTRAPPGLLCLPEVNMADQTDCFMTVAAVAAVAAGVTRITGISNQRVKECNRIAAMVTELGKLGIEAWELPDGIAIRGTAAGGGDAACSGEQQQPPAPAPPHGALVHCYDDHRIAMSLSCLAAVLPGVTLDDAACVDKTYPEWWDVLQGTLGTRVEGVDAPSAPAPAPATSAPHSTPAPASPVHTIVLIGMRGAGKSSLAAEACRVLQWPVVDLDALLCARAGKGSCAEVVAALGWEAFRALEADILASTLAQAPAAGCGRIVACGGGVVETESCRSLLRSLSLPLHPAAGVCTVWVERAIEDIEEDIEGAVQAGQDEGRPRYAGGLTLRDMYARRLPWYSACAPAHVFTIARGDRGWADIGARWGDYLRRIRAPLPAVPVRPLTHAAAAAVADITPLSSAGTSFLCLALPDVAALGPPGAGIQGAADALWLAARDSDAVELRVDCLAGVASSAGGGGGGSVLVDAGVAAYVRQQHALLRAALALGARRALYAGQGSTADAPRAMPSLPAKPVIWTVRSAGEGGHWAGGEEGYAAWVRLGLACGAEWVDIEAGKAGQGALLSRATALQLASEARAAGVRVIGSAHWPASSCSTQPSRAELQATAARAWAGGAGCDLVKLIVSVSDTSQALCVMQDFSSVRACLAEAASSLLPTPCHPPPLLGLAMGQAGALTRALATVWAPVTHSVLPVKAAPGQLSALACRALRTATAALTPCSFFLFGNPIGQSLSPGLHNAGFAALGLPHRYGLVPTEDAAYVLSVLRGTAAPVTLPPYEGRQAAQDWTWPHPSFPPVIGGGSVTMPLKQDMAALCDSLGSAARELGAVNALTVYAGGHVRGDNTDWVGIAQPLAQALGRRAAARQPQQGSGSGSGGGGGSKGGAAMLIIGAGGTCLAAAYAARALGLRVLVANRTLARAQDVVAKLLTQGASTSRGAPLPPCALQLSEGALHPDELAQVGVQEVAALVCTLPPSAAWTAPPALLAAYHPAVLDVAYRPRRTPLLEQARAAGCEEIEGVQMLLAQGLAAFAIWTGKSTALGASLWGAETVEERHAEEEGSSPWGPGVPVPEMAAATYKLLEQYPVLQ